VSDERSQAPLGPEAGDDVHMFAEYGQLMNVDLPTGRSLLNRGADNSRIALLDRSLSQPCMPGDVHVETEGSMRHVERLECRFHRRLKLSG